MVSQNPQRRLRTLLTVPFVGLILAPSLIIALSSLYAGLRAVDTLSERLITDISGRVEQAAVHQLEEAAITLRATYPEPSDAHDGSLAVFANPTLLERKLFELTAAARTTSYMFYGAENGAFIGVDRGRAGARAAATVRVQDDATQPRKIYSARAPLDRSRLIEVEARVFDARTRPWYVKAKQQNRLIWTPVYISFASGALVTTASQPVVSRDGRLMGVLAADVGLGELSDFMKSVNVSENGVAYIVDHEGYLVASSAPGEPFRINQNAQNRVRPSESGSAISRDSALWWQSLKQARSVQEDIEPASARGKLRSAKIDGAQGESIDVATRRIANIEGVDWDIVVAIPRSDFTAPIVRSAVLMFVVIVAALAAALQLGLWIVRRVTGDVEALVRASNAYSIDAEPFQPPRTTLRETSDLAAAFSGMFARLRESLGTIREQNEDLAAINMSLEERVERRTRQLEAKNSELVAEVERRSALEADVRAASQAATKQADDKARFMAILSHELRTPLQAVIGASEMLASKMPVEANEINILKAASKSILTLVDGVLSYSKLEAGKVQPLYSRFSLAEVIDESIALSRLAHPGRAVAVDCAIAADVPVRVESDAGMVRQLLMNLLQNAFKYAHGSPVRIDVTAGTNLGTSPEAAQVGVWTLSVCVSDNGPGIPQASRERLFKPFEQVGQGSADPSRGSGLGLAICAMLARSLGGDIAALDDHAGAGTGARIGFWIPVRTASSMNVAGSSLASLSDAGTTGSPLAILLVEDHPVNQRLVTEMLRALGHRVHAVGSGGDACAAFADTQSAEARFEYDVVLMDLNLPDFSGIEAAQRISASCQAAGRTRPALIALTASADESDRLACAAAGMRERITKPATIQSLRTALATYALEKMRNSLLERNNELANEPNENIYSERRKSEMLNLSMLLGLAEVEKRGNTRFVAAVITEFVDGLDAELDAVFSALRTGDSAALKRRVHALSGAASSVGARALADCLRASEIDGVASAIESLTQVASQTRMALIEWRDAHVARSAR